MIGICGTLTKNKTDKTKEILQKLSMPFSADERNHLRWSKDNRSILLVQSSNYRAEDQGSRDVDAIIFGHVYMTGNGGSGSVPDDYLSGKDLVELYKKKGANCFSLLDGSWVAAIADYRNKKILIARDRRGFKHIYFRAEDGIFSFSTSIRSFENAFRLSIDPDSVKMFLHYLYIPSPKTIYSEVRAVEPGECIAFTAEDGVSRIQFTEEVLGYPWLLRGSNSYPDSETALATFEDLMIKAVERQISKTKKTGILLSGGKDSSAIAAAAALSGQKNVECITVGFDETEIDEGAKASEIARHLGLPHRLVRFSDSDYVNSLYHVIKCLDQPMGDSAVFPAFLAVARTCDEFDVYLEGSGCDAYFINPASGIEKLSWYTKKYMPWVSNLFKGNWKVGLSFRANVLVKNMRREHPEQFIVWKGWTETEIKMLMGSMPGLDELTLYKFYSKVNSPDFFKTLTFSVCASEAYVRKIENVCAYLNVDARFPYFNNLMTSFCQSLPKEMLYSGMKNKILMRQFLGKHLPAELVNTPKGYFIFRKKTILKAKNFGIMDQFLSNDILLKHNLVDHKIAGKCIEKYKSGDYEHEDKVWSLFLLHCWLESRENLVL